MKRKTGRGVLWLLFLAALVAVQPVQAFPFCFSIGGNNNRHAPYSPYPPPWPPPGAYYRGVPVQPYMPGAVYPYPPYPYPQPSYGAQVPLPPDSNKQ